jgi:hypothetical protein
MHRRLNFSICKLLLIQKKIHVGHCTKLHNNSVSVKNHLPLGEKNSSVASGLPAIMS